MNMTNMNDKVIGGFDKEYYDWIAELSTRYRQGQIKAAIRVNSEMLRFYWSVGKDIEERKCENKYGSHFYENLSCIPQHSKLSNRLLENWEEQISNELLENHQT